MKKMLSIVAVLAMIFVLAIPAFAVDQQVIKIPASQTWTTAGSCSRTTNYTYIYARCHSVYPDSGADFFGKVQCRVRNSNATVISEKEYVVLDEGADSFTQIDLKQGYLSATSVYVQFRGNTDKAANAVVSYYSN